MRKNLFKSLLTMCALGAMFTACSNEGNEVPTVEQSDVKPVFMKLNLGKTETRAEETPINGGTTATVKNLHIYFYKDADKSIQKYIKIPQNEVMQYTAGKEISDVPVAADKVLIRGNVPTTVLLPTGGSLNNVINKEIEITTQNDNDEIILGHVYTSSDADIKTWNGSGATPIAGMSSGTKYASVTIEPGVARIEVEGLKASGAISQFSLDGIYVNNFYKKLKLGDGSSSDKVQYGTDPSKYAQGQGLYQVANTKLFDQFTPAKVANAKEIAVTGGKRWAYHAFSNDAVAANDQLQLMFKLSSLTASGGITFPAGNQFLTVRGFRDKTTNEIVKLEKGKIYTISKADFTFDESNLTSVPNTNAVGVWLKVTVKPWTVVAVKPNL